jgi:hypothetical protein
MNRRVLLLLAVLVALAIAAHIFLIQYTSLDSDISYDVTSQTNTQERIPTSPTSTQPTTTAPLVPHFYAVDVKIPDSASVSLGGILPRIPLKTPGVRGFNVLYMKTGEIKFNFNQETLVQTVAPGMYTLYLRSDRPEGSGVDLGTYPYGNSLTATVSTIDPKVLPYIQDRSYCEVTADCVPGYGDGCRGGFFNKYVPIPETHGCYGDYSITQEEKLMCPSDPEKDFFQHTEAEYAGPQCIQNKCVASERVLVCVDGMGPP